MNFYYYFLLLLVVLSAYSEHGKPDPVDLPVVAVCPISNSDPLGVLAPVLPHGEMFGSVLSQNMVLPQNGVYRTVLPHEVFGSVLQNRVSKFVLPQNEVSNVSIITSELSNVNLLNIGVKSFTKSTLTLVYHQNDVNISVLPQHGVFRVVVVNWQLSDDIKAVIDFVLSFGVKGFKILMSTLTDSGQKLGWTIRILLESLRHVLKMYTWSISESQASIQLRCKLIRLLLKQSLFRKHDFALLVHKVCHDHLYLCFWHLNFFPKFRNNTHTYSNEQYVQKSTRYQFHGGGKAPLFSSAELLPYASTDFHEQQYQFLHCVTKKQKQSFVLRDGDVLCNMPLDILSPKLTLKSAKELANLHDIYMPSKILLKNAQILLEDHKCETCEDVFVLFRPSKVASNAERQQTWYQKNTTKRAESDKHRSSKTEYQNIHKKSSQKHYISKKNVKFPPDPPSTKLCQNIVLDFCVDTSAEVFEEVGCAVCGKLTPICKMEELSEVENVSLLKADGVTRKARSKGSDPVKELGGPILAPACNKVCPLCTESLDKKKVPTLALANGLWIGEIPDELQGLTYAEQLLIARVCHNRCIVKVSSGMYKMRANAISFSNPMPKIYNVLPPPIEEMDEVLAFIYTGPCKSSKSDFK